MAAAVAAPCDSTPEAIAMRRRGALAQVLGKARSLNATHKAEAVRAEGSTCEFPDGP